MMLSEIFGDEVEVTLGGHTLVLRPTLRAGVAALRLHGNFKTLLAKIDEMDTATIAKLMEIGCGASASHSLSIAGMSGLAILREPLADYVVILANGGMRPMPHQTPERESGASGSGSHEDYFASLMKRGTGWIGWTPDQTLDAVMPAIVTAFIGRQGMLRWCLGGDEDVRTKNSIPLADKLRMAMDHLGTTKVERE